MPRVYHTVSRLPEPDRLLAVIVAAFLVVLSISSSVEAAEPTAYRLLSLRQKLAGRDLTFALTFDTGASTADFATGDAAAIGVDDPALAPAATTRGFDGRSAFSTPDRPLSYHVANNVDPRRGSLILWAMGENYSPQARKHADLNKAHDSYVWLRFVDGDKRIDFHLYQYFSRPAVVFYRKASGFAEPAKADGEGERKPNLNKGFDSTQADIRGMGRGVWSQLAITWDEDRMRLFFNGEMRDEIPLNLSASAKETLRGFATEDANSFIGVRKQMFKRVHDKEHTTGIDDLKIYVRALTASEVKLHYLNHVKGQEKQAAALARVKIDTRVDGVDDGGERIDKAELSLNYAPLAAPWHSLIERKQARMSLEMQTPGGDTVEDSWTPRGLIERHILRGVSAPGAYTALLTATGPQGETQSQRFTFERPPTPWLGNKLGIPETVPAPWTPIVLDRDSNAVSVWGRRYVFGQSPLPRQVEHGGAELLAAAPRLTIRTAQGIEDLRYVVGKVERHPLHVEFSGSASSDNIEMTWRTRVEFDGLIRHDFTITNSPEIESMHMDWTVNPAFSRYLLTPTLQNPEGAGEWRFPFLGEQQSGWTNNTTLWLSSETKGFAWTAEHDANWVYDKPPLSVRIDEQGGHCRLSMITAPVRLPPDSDYHAMFTATPARPLPDSARVYRLGKSASAKNTAVRLIQNMGQGTRGIFSLLPDENFSLLMKQEREKGGGRKLAIYDAATGYNTYLPEGKYLRNTWEIPAARPGARDFFDPMKQRRSLGYENCPNTHFTDLKMHNLSKFLAHPDEWYDMIYYDLSVIYRCSNRYHGCRFEDGFGRVIDKLDILGMRELLLRTMVLAHADGKKTLSHGWGQYNPAVHGFADYWHPGEQYTHMKKYQGGGPWIYTDDIPTAVWRSELNPHLKGSGVIFLPNLRRGNKAYGTAEHTVALATMLLLHDVPTANFYADPKVIDTIWGVMLDYKLGAAKVHFYYEQTEVPSSNENIKLTWYKCPGDRYLLVLGNMTPETQTGIINIARLRKGLQSVTGEFGGETWPVANDTLKVSLGPRSFAMIGIPSERDGR